MKRKISPVSLIPAVLWYGLIFYFSAQSAETSGGQSGGLIHRLLSLISNLFRNAEEIVQITSIELLSFFVRKAAHMTLYLVLCLLVFFALRHWKPWRWVASPAICFLLATLDEYHQTFVLGRSGELRDALVDLSGSLIGLLLIYLVNAVRNGHPRRIPRVLLGVGLIALVLIFLFPDALNYPFFAVRYAHGDAETLLNSSYSPEQVLPLVSQILHQFCVFSVGCYLAVSAIYSLIFFKNAKKESCL